MRLRLEQDDGWLDVTINAANEAFEAMLARGMTPGQVGMAATFILTRLIEANEATIGAGHVQLVSHKTWKKVDEPIMEEGDPIRRCPNWFHPPECPGNTHKCVDDPRDR